MVKVCAGATLSLSGRDNWRALFLEASMGKIWLVLRHEIRTTLGSKSFLFLTFGLPALFSLVFLAVTALSRGASGIPGGAGGAGDPSRLQVEGYVDQSGLVKAIPTSVPRDILVPYPDEAAAREALRAGEVAAYYVIAADYVASGDLLYVNPKYNFATSRGQSWVMRQTLFANLLGNDAERIARAARPMDVKVTALSPAQDTRDEDNPATFFVPYISMMLLYVVILMAASLLLNSVATEKKNRVMEILLSSVSPRQMLTGKIVGLGLLGLLQTAIWMGTGYTFLLLGGQTLQLPAGFTLPPSILIWGFVFFLLGYAVYASLMAGLGALVPNLREASQAVILVIWPLIIPLMLSSILIEKPHDPLATVLSIFPLTAPIAMITRLAAGGVPWWQPLLAVGLLVITALIIIRAVANTFRAQTLLSGQPFTVGRYWAALLGRG
ncbi:MAG: ABC transporter permease [Anaerolineae bacterium]|nr:ABC transporter permease [Anaerolineae bacterium]